MFIKKSLVLLFIFLLCGCSDELQSNAEFSPQVNVPITQIGHNKKIFVVVEDARPDDVIGRAGTGDNITIEQKELLKYIKDQIDRGLSNNKFILTDNDKQASTTLTVRILGIQYRQMNLAQNSLTNHALATVVLESIVTSKGKIFKKAYRTDNNNYYMMSVFVNEIPQINSTIANTIEKLFVDNELVEFMAK